MDYRNKWSKRRYVNSRRKKWRYGNWSRAMGYRRTHRRYLREPILDALEAGKVRNYVCDFPLAALLGRKGVILLPHLGASTAEAEDNCAVMIADQLRDFLENGNIRNAVNFPEVVSPRAEDAVCRLCVANANVPNMVSQISSALGEANLNIVDLLNKSRGEYAYTMVDLSDQVSPETLEKIKAINGVLTARVI